MDQNGRPEEESEAEIQELATYLMRFAVKSHTLIQRSNPDDILEHVMASAREIYAYKQGEKLPVGPQGRKKPHSTGFRLV